MSARFARRAPLRCSTCARIAAVSLSRARDGEFPPHDIPTDRAELTLHPAADPLMIRPLIKKVEALADLSRQEAASAMEEILSGRSDEETIVALLAALRAKGETVGEL